MSALFEPAPGWCTLLTLGRLLGKAGSSGPGGGSGGSTGAAGSDGIAEVDMDEDGGGGTPMAANGSGSGSGGAMRQGGSGEEDGEEEEAAGKAAQPGRSRWAAMDDSSEDEGTAAAAARKRKKLGGAGGSSGGLGVDDWRDLLASGKQALAGKTPGSAPRGILSRCSGGSNGNGSGRASAGKKRVRWPDEVRAVVVLAMWCACVAGAYHFVLSCFAGLHCLQSHGRVHCWPPPALAARCLPCRPQGLVRRRSKVSASAAAASGQRQGWRCDPHAAC